MAKFPIGIEHVVVLCLENRSFDHMLGFLGTPNGLTGDEFNLTDPDDPASARVPVSNTAEYLGDLDVDPSHEVTQVREQLYGAAGVPRADGRHNVGFVLNYGRQPGAPQAPNIMKCFDPAKLPTLVSLAREYAVCGRWYSSVPGQTWPNRFFLHCATSGGFADNKLRTFPMRTIYENIEDAHLEWGIYFHDIPQSLTLERLQTPARRARFKLFQAFASDAAAGRLPNYAFLEPRYFNTPLGKANDQHPPHDVQLGEHLIADIYEALRQSPAWGKTLFVIVYDEHGGIYDHVLPPAAVNPDGRISADPPCDFTQLGLRVPAVLVSPRIARATVDDTPHDHTSLLATVKEIFGLKEFLTERDRQAKTFTQLLAARARADAPERAARPAGPADLPPSVAAAFDAGFGAAGEQPSEFQESLLDFADGLPAPEGPSARALRLAQSIDQQYADAIGRVARFLTR